MSATTSSRRARNSKKSGTPKLSLGKGSVSELLWVFFCAALLSAAAIWFFSQNGSLYYFGDAEAHLNIARRVLDSRTPGYRQLGTVWLPLPHLLMLPFVGNMKLWQSGLAGSIPSGCCFVWAACLFFAAARKALRSSLAAALAVALLVLSPNNLYLQSSAMTEPVFLLALAGILYSTVSFQASPAWRYVVYAGLFAAAGTLCRYEGWFLLPFTALFFWIAAPAHRWQISVLFCALAGAGPLYWFIHNWWIFDNPLEFYNGLSSPRAIQGGKPYPGMGDWKLAIQYFTSAAKLVADTPLFWAGLVSSLACIVEFRSRLWPLILLSLPPLFYVWSMHSSGGSPIFIPELPPHSYYNTRYGLALLPFLAFACSVLVAAIPPSARLVVAAVLLLVCVGPWLVYPRPEAWVTWKESQVNSEARRAWTEECVSFLQGHYQAGQTILTAGGDVIGVYRKAGIPIRNLLTGDNGGLFDATLARPDLFLWEHWVVALTGDPIQTAVDRAGLRGPKYKLARETFVTGGPVIQIYQRPANGPHIGK